MSKRQSVSLRMFAALVAAVFLMSLASSALADDRQFWVDPEGVSDPAALELIEAEKGWWIAAGDSGGYTFLPNGAKYKILRSRVTEDDIKNGVLFAKPSLSSVIRTNYEVRLVKNDTVVERSWKGDSSFEDVISSTSPGQPRAVKMESLMTALVPGLRDALLQMTVDDVYEVAVPSRLAFGPVAVGSAFRRTIVRPIPAYSTLIYKIHLQDILNFESADSKKMVSERQKLNKQEL